MGVETPLDGMVAVEEDFCFCCCSDSDKRDISSCADLRYSCIVGMVVSRGTEPMGGGFCCWSL